MIPLEVSINNTVDNPEEISLLIQEYEQKRKTQIDLKIFDWTAAWTEFMKISIYQNGPVVSETGDTWMGSLAARNNLRQFRKNEIAAIGGAGEFFGPMWQSCIDFDGENIVAIPWSLDTYLVYYRRDLLAKAGVDEGSAFTNCSNFIETLQKLQEAGIENPIVLTTGGKSSNIMIEASSWVWQAGGDFISPDGKTVTFTKPETLAGLKNYFGLHRFLSPTMKFMDTSLGSNLFNTGKAAISFQNPFLLYNLKHGILPRRLEETVGVTVHPCTPFVGGSNLVIWKHIFPDQERAAVELVQYLTSSDSMTVQFQKTGLIPARLAALRTIETDPDYVPVFQSLKNGRAYKRLPLWGLVEDRLIIALDGIWRRILNGPEADLEELIHSALSVPEERLNLTLSQ